MRILVFLLGLVASLVTGFFGCFWVVPSVTEAVNEAVKPYYDFSFLMPNIAEWYTTSWAAFFMFVGAGLGLLGCVLILMGRGKHAAVLMFLSMVGPATLSPVTLAFTGLQGFVGLISVFIRPRAPAEPEIVEAVA